MFQVYNAQSLYGGRARDGRDGRGEKRTGDPVCIMPWRTIVLNWGKERKIVLVKMTVLKDK